MGNRHIFIGLSEFGYQKAREAASLIENAIYFGISDIAYQPCEHYHVYYNHRLKPIDYYNFHREEVKEWNDVNPIFYDFKGNHLSRADFRMVYEQRDIAIQHNAWEDLIFDEELSQVSEGDTINIVIPFFENSAHGVAFFVAWDIKEWYAKHNLNVSVIAHFILPDTPLYNPGSMVELMSDYRASSAFIKELIAITQISNGDIEIRKKLEGMGFSLSRWFDMECDFGNHQKLPFDKLSMVGLNAPIDFKEHESNDKIRNMIAKQIADNAICQDDILDCLSPTFVTDLYSKYPLFSTDGRATAAYDEFIAADKSKFFYESPHLDFHWDGVL